MIPFKTKLLTKTAKAPTQENEGDLWDLYADDFCSNYLKDFNYSEDEYIQYGTSNCFLTNHEIIRTSQDVCCRLDPQGRILVKTGIALELPKQYSSKFFSYQ